MWSSIRTVSYTHLDVYKRQIENQCMVGKRTKIQTNAYIAAYSVVGDDCFIGPCVVTSNDNYVGRTKARFAAFRGVTVLNLSLIHI